MAHKILVVDDQPFMLRLIQHHLERAGYELIKARNPQEAQSAIAQEGPHLVVMTEKANDQVAVPENKIPASTASIPVIRMTDVPATMPEQKESGDEVIFRKPFSPTKLVAEVRRLLPEVPPETI